MTVVLPGYTVIHRPAGAVPEHWIIRAHAGACTPGAVLKESGGGTPAPAPPLEPLTAYADRLQAPVVVNASGWWGDTGVQADLMGAQITSGQIVKDWEPHSTQSWVGTRCVAVMRDGTLRTYTLNTPAADMLADGVWHTFSQGALALIDGEPTNFAGSLTYAAPSARMLIADDWDGDLLLITVPGKTGSRGATGQQILDLAAPLNLRTLALLDGGGSAQLIIDGVTIMPSSDLLNADGTRSDLPARAVPQALAFHAPRIGPFPVVFRTLTERRPGWSGGVARVAVTPERVEGVLTGVSWGGPGAVKVGQPDGKATVLTLPEDIPRPPLGWPNLAYLNTQLGDAQNARVGTGGTVDVSASAPGAVAVTFSYPVSAQ